MKILKRKLVSDKLNVRTELLHIDYGCTIVYNNTMNNGVVYGEIFHVIGFDEVGDFNYNTEGMSIGNKKSDNIKKASFELLENFFNKMQDKDRYKKTLDILTDNYYDYRKNHFNLA